MNDKIMIDFDEVTEIFKKFFEKYGEESDEGIKVAKRGAIVDVYVEVMRLGEEYLIRKGKL